MCTGSVTGNREEENFLHAVQSFDVKKETSLELQIILALMETGNQICFNFSAPVTVAGVL